MTARFFFQINGGSQSFNTLSFLRNLGRWMRMFVIPNQVRSLPPHLLTSCLCVYL